MPKAAPKPHARTWGEGSVKEVRAGVWRAWRARAGGSRPSRTFKGDAAAQRAATWARGDVEPAVLLVSHWLARWLALRLPILRPSSQRNYRRHIAACAPLTDRPLADVTTEELQALANTLLSRWSRAHVAVWRSVTRSAFRAAVPRYRPDNPMDGVKLPAPVEKAVKAWNADELVQLVRAARGYKHEAWFWLSIGTGIRLGESRALLWTDVNYADKTVTISKSVDTRTNVLGPTKSGRTRIVDVPDEVLQMLSAHRKRQPPSELYVIGSRAIGRKRAPVLAMALNRWLYRLCVRAGVRPLSPHSARHTFSTLSLEAGVPLKEVSEALGHANVAITAATYSHAVEVRRRRAASAIGAALTAQTTPLRLLKAVDGTVDGTRPDG